MYCDDSQSITPKEGLGSAEMARPSHYYAHHTKGSTILSLSSNLSSILHHTTHCRLVVSHPVLTLEQLEAVKTTEYRGWKARTIDITFPTGTGPQGLQVWGRSL